MLFVALFAFASVAEADEAASGLAPCRLEAFAMGTVGSVIDGRTFALADGSTVRLAGIEVAQAPRPGESQAGIATGATARAALEKLGR
jgi:endonuclease YncB( thermonuclease family)